MPKVSVIIPNYNYKRFLRQRVESVLSQSYGDYEVILLDDCSTDGSQEVIAEYSCNEKVSAVVLGEKNTGSPFLQWDKGLSLARGEYVWIAESDDYADKDFLRETVKALDDHPQAVIAAACSQFVDVEGKYLQGDYDKVPLDGRRRVYKSGDFIRHGLAWSNRLYNASMILFRRKAYDGVSSRYKDMKYCGDWLFWTEMASQGDVVKIHQRLNFFRQHASSITASSTRNAAQLEERLDVYQYIRSRFAIGWYREWMISGIAYKHIRRFGLERLEQEAYIEKYHLSKCKYLFERLMKSLSQIFPFIVTSTTDITK